MNFEPRQIMVVHESVWESLCEWARQHKLDVTQITNGDGDYPTYCFTLGDAARAT